MFQRYLLLFALVLTNSVYAQETVTWAYAYDAQSSSIRLEATIAPGWHMYSQKIEIGIGPVPTSFTFDKSKDYKVIGATNEPTPIVKYDPNFDGELAFFAERAVFVQKIKVKNSGNVEGAITFMACNDEMCLPPVDELFTISIEK